MPNFVNVGSQYILSNLDVKIPKVDSVLNVNTNGNIENLCQFVGSNKVYF